MLEESEKILETLEMSKECSDSELLREDARGSLVERYRKNLLSEDAREKVKRGYTGTILSVLRKTRPFLLFWRILSAGFDGHLSSLRRHRW